MRQDWVVLTALAVCVSAGAVWTASAFAVTEGWENIAPDRKNFPVARELWSSRNLTRDDLSVSFREGAEGAVDWQGGILTVVKSNDIGKIVISAPPFPSKKGTKVRFNADLEIAGADPLYSSALMRGYGTKEDLNFSIAGESLNFWMGGQQEMRGMVNTAPGMTNRRIGQYVAVTNVVTPALVVCGKRSRSVWHNWSAEDIDASLAAWTPYFEAHRAGDRSGERMDETSFDALIASEKEHTAKIVRLDGISRLVVDGVVSAPVAYKSKHVLSDGIRHETFAGKCLDGSDVKLMVKEIRLGGTEKCRGYWTSKGFDSKGAVREIKDAMRLAPHSNFLIGIGVTAYPDYTLKEHPDQVWLNPDGTPLVGTLGSCMPGYGMPSKGTSNRWPWVSYASRVWRNDVKSCIRDLVGELKRQGLSKRIVGTHIYGYHDGQMSFPYPDHSKAMQTEVARLIAAGGLISTNYDFVCKQTKFFAQEEFAEAFKTALGKDSIAVLWCESPFGGVRTCSLDITAFCRSKWVDALVAQPHYRERRPGLPITNVMPIDSLHLHGKMFWNEFDLRTYGALEMWSATGWPSIKSLGQSEDFPMWQTVYRKHAGEMTALRMGYWFYDMGGGWFAPPEISSDIRQETAEERRLAQAKPSPWKPGVAVVIDEGAYLQGSNAINRIVWQDGYLYEWAMKNLATSGVPYRRYLMQDVLEAPEILSDARMVVFALMRRVDAARAKMIGRLADERKTLVFLSQTATWGGAEATGFAPYVKPGEHEHAMRAEPDVADAFFSAVETNIDRDYNIPLRPGFRGCGVRCSVREAANVRVLARYVQDGLPAFAERTDGGCRRLYVCEPAGLTPDIFNRLAREAGAYAAFDRAGVQTDMNGDFVSLHCLQPGAYEFRLPYECCRMVNAKSGREEPSSHGKVALELTAGETCQFLLSEASQGLSLREYVAAFNAADDETVTNAVPNAEAAAFLEMNVPRFSCPDPDVERTYYFRWWTYRKHIRKGRDGRVVSEFLPNVGHAGPDNAISCPVGHHFMEGRWLRDTSFLRDYAKFWLRPDARLNGPRSYVNWIVQGVLSLEKVTGDRTLADGLLDGLVANYRAWERGWAVKVYPTGKTHRVGLEPDGLFTDIDDREGTELTLSGNGKRIHVNAMMWGEAKGIAAIARRNGRAELADEFDRKAGCLEKGVRTSLWNPVKKFFTVRSDDGSLSDVCELHGYSPWYVGMPLDGCEAAWGRLVDPKGFAAPWGLTFPCQDTPGFRIAYTGHSCQWNGPSWPFATSIALTALANALDTGYRLPIGRKDFSEALVRYAKSHVMERADGTRVPWIDEVQDPYTGVWTSRAIQNGGMVNGTRHTNGKDYNHSTFCDLVITGIAGFRPREGGKYEVKPLAPEDWNWWSLDNVSHCGKCISIRYDRDGRHFGQGKGLRVSETAFVSPADEPPQKTAAAVFEKQVVNAFAVRRAVWSVTAQGVFEAYVNGRRVGEDFLKPGFTSSEKCRHVYTYDVTHLLDCAKDATNVLSATVAPGWWCDAMMTRPGKTPWQLGKKLAFRGELELEYADGTHSRVGTDPTWRSAYSGPVVAAGIYEGETYDARRKVEDLKPSVINWEFSGELRPSTAKVTLRRDLELGPRDVYVTRGAEGATSNAFGKAKIVRRAAVDGSVRLEPGELLVVDFGQNAAAVPAFSVVGEEGTTVTVRHAEMLNEANGEKSRGNDGPAGTPYLASLRSAKATLSYTLGAGANDFVPRHTFFGYRYLAVTSTGPVTFPSFRSMPVSSVTKEMERGSITTGRARVNRLIENVRWGVLSNYLSIPTDCPQRDERMGWTADTQVFMTSAAYLLDTYGFLSKYLEDMRDAQYPDGLYPCFVPNLRHVFPHWASCGWTDAGVIIPHRLWKWYGKLEVVERHWASMKRYMDFLELYDEPYRINHGDWLAFEHTVKKKDGTDGEAPDPRQVYLLNDVFRIWMARLMREMAEATGRTDAALHYGAEETKHRAAFAGKYVAADGCLKDEYKGQCNDLYMLMLGLCGNAEATEATKRDLVATIRAHGNRLQTGFLGTAILMPILTDVVGAPDVAYDLLLQNRFPSWLYSVDQGATTVWERWNGYTKEKGFGPVTMNSFNHYAYGCVLEWLFSAAAGIRPDPKGGWRHFVLRPHPDRRLGSCTASFRSDFGTIRSAWQYADGAWHWTFTVPDGATADVFLPGESVSRLHAPGTYRVRRDSCPEG